MAVTRTAPPLRPVRGEEGPGAVQLSLPVRPVVAAGTAEVERGCGAQLRETLEGDVLGVEDPLDRAQRAPAVQRPAWQ